MDRFSNAKGNIGNPPVPVLDFPSTFGVARPEPVPVTPSASDTTAAWKKVRVERPSFTRILSGARNIYYTPWEPRAGDIALGLYYKDVGGRAILPQVGDWWFYMPSSDGASAQTLLIFDGSSDSPMQPEQSSPSIAPTNVAQIGGTTQTGLDLTAQYAPYTMASPAQANVAAASASVLAASATRRFLYLKNNHASLDISIGFGAAAVLYSGITLRPGEWVALSTPTGHVQSEIFAIASAAGPAILGIQEGT